MLSRVAAQEQTVTGGDFKIFSIAPDTVDTDMQAQTRKPDKSEFSQLDTFIAIKKTEN
jgi:NAD(P)-dependent dehydrogenase (short-subunit alcohol dehydrogenase family)